MKDKILNFGYGFVYSILATVAFAAFGWITIDPGNRIFAIPLVALISWTFAYFSVNIIFFFLAVISMLTMGIGFFIGLGVVAYYLMQIATFVIPPNWVLFTVSEGGLFFMGAFYTFLAFSVHNSNNEIDSVDEDDEEDYED